MVLFVADSSRKLKLTDNGFMSETSPIAARNQPEDHGFPHSPWERTLSRFRVVTKLPSVLYCLHTIEALSAVAFGRISSTSALRLRAEGREAKLQLSECEGE